MVAAQPPAIGGLAIFRAQLRMVHGPWALEPVHSKGIQVVRDPAWAVRAPCRPISPASLQCFGSLLSILVSSGNHSRTSKFGHLNNDYFFIPSLEAGNLGSRC